MVRGLVWGGLAGIVFIGVLHGSAARGQDPWADQVVSYAPGDGAAFGYTNPLVALGEPARMTGAPPFVGAVTPFNPPWLPQQIVSIGAGGHLTLRFDEPITDNPAHPFGVDFILFGDGFFIDGSYPHGVVAGLFADGPFTVAVSADGSHFVPLTGAFTTGLFPTLGYLDLTGPYDPNPGSVPTDFTRPVDPDLTLNDFLGRTFAEVVTLYAGSGGGVPFDLDGTGLGAIHYLRIDVPPGAGSVEIDALAVVPEPLSAAAFLLVALAALRLRRPPAPHLRVRRCTSAANCSGGHAAGGGEE